MKLKRLSYTSLATAKIHGSSKPQLVPGCTKPLRFTSAFFFLLSKHTYRVCLFTVIWEWLKIHLVLLDKRPLPKRRTALSFEHISQGPWDVLEPGLMGCFWAGMLADGSWARFNGLFLSRDAGWWAKGRIFCAGLLAPGDYGSAHVSVQVRMLVGRLVPWWLRYLAGGSLVVHLSNHTAVTKDVPKE